MRAHRIFTGVTVVLLVWPVGAATYDPEMAQGLEENLLKLGLSTISSWVAQNAASVWYDVVRETLLWYSEPLVTEGGAAEVPVGFLEFRFDELRLGGFDAPDFNFLYDLQACNSTPKAPATP